MVAARLGRGAATSSHRVPATSRQCRSLKQRSPSVPPNIHTRWIASNVATAVWPARGAGGVPCDRTGCQVDASALNIQASSVYSDSAAGPT